MTRIYAATSHETRRAVPPSGDTTTPMSKERHSLSMPITEYFWVSSIMSLERAKLF
jgi:hypothetical protein